MNAKNECRPVTLYRCAQLIRHASGSPSGMCLYRESDKYGGLSGCTHKESVNVKGTGLNICTNPKAIAAAEKEENDG